MITNVKLFVNDSALQDWNKGPVPLNKEAPVPLSKEPVHLGEDPTCLAPIGDSSSLILPNNPSPPMKTLLTKK